MKDLQDELGTTYLFIAHDLSMVKYISDRIGVMHLGHIVETGTTDEIFENPVHPYTRSLLSAIPHPNPRVEKKRVAVEYDKEKEGVDYTAGHLHQLTDTHSVLATDEEFAVWSKNHSY
jgi:oligopeptide transport system ATP-binding protein